MSKPGQQDLPITVIVCRRGRRRAAPCSVCSEPHTKLCDFPLKGSKEGQTCDAKLCDTHASRSGPPDYCPAHARFVARKAKP